MNAALSECQFDMFSEPEYIQVLRDTGWFNIPDLAIKLGYRHFSYREFQNLWYRTIRYSCMVCRDFPGSKTPGNGYKGFHEMYRYSDTPPLHHIEILIEDGAFTGRIYPGREPTWANNINECTGVATGKRLQEVATALFNRYTEAE